MSVTPEMVLAKLDELSEMLGSVETATEPVKAIANWRAAGEVIATTREYWVRSVVNHDRTIRDLIDRVLGPDYIE